MKRLPASALKAGASIIVFLTACDLAGTDLQAGAVRPLASPGSTPAATDSGKEAAALFVTEIVKAALANDYFRKELHTTTNAQVVLMSVKPGEDIGREAHDVDQVLVFVEGSGEYVVGSRKGALKAGDLVMVPARTEHNIVNTGQGPLKLYTIYAPPQHPPGTLHRTKAEAEAAEAGSSARPHHH